MVSCNRRKLILDSESLMILKWFDAGEIVLFSQEVIRDIKLLFPIAEKKGKAIPKKDFRKKFEKLITTIRSYASKNKLNLYKKAKFLNAIKWELRESGYEDEFIDDVIPLIPPLLN